ncbi:PHD finger protein 6-like [Lithobates pipiens]
MADVPKVCSFCKTGEDTGSLTIISKDIQAHYNCMLFSPKVTSATQQDSPSEFDIDSVISEIKRGRKLVCGKCKRNGATVGCDREECSRKYHYPCVTKAKGIIIRDEEKEQYM